MIPSDDARCPLRPPLVVARAVYNTSIIRYLKFRPEQAGSPIVTYKSNILAQHRPPTNRKKQFCGHRTDSDNRYAKKAHRTASNLRFRMLHNKV